MLTANFSALRFLTNVFNAYSKGRPESIRCNIHISSELFTRLNKDLKKLLPDMKAGFVILLKSTVNVSVDPNLTDYDITIKGNSC